MSRDNVTRYRLPVPRSLSHLKVETKAVGSPSHSGKLEVLAMLECMSPSDSSIE